MNLPKSRHGSCVVERSGKVKHESASVVSAYICIRRIRGGQFPVVPTHSFSGVGERQTSQTDAAELARALYQLPDATRSVLWLYHGEGYTHEEIAALMGKSVSFSKSQLSRGARRLRALLDPDLPVAAHG